MKKLLLTLAAMLAGERLGWGLADPLAGLVGAGRSELAKAISKKQ